MKSRVVATVAGLLMATAAFGAAQAQIRLDRPVGQTPQQPAQPSGTITSITADGMLRLLSQVGFSKGETLNLENNLKGIKAEVNGTPVFVVLSGCEGNACTNFAFFTFFGKQQVGSDFINGFNRDRRYGRLYIDKDGDLALTLDAWMYGGVTSQFIAQTGVIFATTIKTLIEYKP